MLRAFNRDFERNGPSVIRIVRTTLTGWKRYKNHPDACIRDRYAWEARELGTTFSALVGAAKLYYRNNPAMYAKMSALAQGIARRVRLEIASVFGDRRTLGSASNPQRGKTPRFGLDLRAKDILRTQRRGYRSGGGRIMPFGIASHCTRVQAMMLPVMISERESVAV